MKQKILVCLLMLSPACLAQQKVAVIGTGYVGLVLGTCLADFDHDVLCADIDKTKIESLKNGIIPIYEPGLKELADACVQKNTLHYTADVSGAIDWADVVFIAVGTPMDDEGKADMRAVHAVAREIGRSMRGYKVVCTKSTVPIGAGNEIALMIKQHQNKDIPFDYVSNPEFLKEGTAVTDFLYPDRVVFGFESQKARDIMDDLYAPLLKRSVPFVYTNVISAETIKYASNSFLALKVAFTNEIARDCELTRADIDTVTKGMGLDKRIGPQFLKPGPGFGGSCFPKDVQALLYQSRSRGNNLSILDAAYKSNELQKEFIYRKIKRVLGNDLTGKTVTLLGLAFKANTDDIRSAPSLYMIEQLIKEGAIIKAYDPVAMANTRHVFPQVYYAVDTYDACAESDLVLVLTEWADFKSMDLERLKIIMKQPNLIDARNIISTKRLNAFGFTYSNIGNASVE